MIYLPLKNNEIRLLLISAGRALERQPEERSSKRLSARLRGLLSHDHEKRQKEKEEGAPCELECSFIVAPLDNCPPFEALSWVWGNTTDMIYIKLNGEPFAIKSTLHSIICNLRPDERPRLIWIDALCINQQDINERNHQVTRMKEIYSQAVNVIVWLGDSWKGDREAFDLIKVASGRRDLHFEPGLGRKCISLDGDDLRSKEMRRSLINFFDRPWWHRLWTVQEYVMASSVTFHCGLRMISDLDLQVFLERLKKHRQSCCRQNDILVRRSVSTGLNINSATNRFSELLKMKRDRNTLHFLQVVAACRRRLASDPRDKIYGLLGLVSQEAMAKLDPSYERSMKQIFEDAVYVFIDQGGDLEVFSHLHSTMDSNMPSFVPNWTTQLDGHIPKSIYFGRLVTASYYNACNNKKPRIRRVGAGSISCVGLVFDTIATVGWPVVKTYEKEELISNCHEVSQIDDKPLAAYVGTQGQTAAAAFSRALCGDVLLFDDVIQSIKDDKDDMVTDIAKRWEISCKRNSGKTGAVSLDNKIGCYHKAVLTNIIGRRFARTDKGYFATVPSDAKVGDFIVVLAGGKLPYVLRSANRDASNTDDCEPQAARYHMRGDAYVQGIMYGEAFLNPEKHGMRFEEIILE